LARPFVQRLRAAVGLRSLSAGHTGPQGAHKAAKAQLPAFKQYREADGKFYFKLVTSEGRLLLQSTGFDAPRDAGQAIARLQSEAGALQALAPQLATVAGVDASEIAAALQALTVAANA
jgi:tryptophanyl-tRNA synthetase